MANWLTRQLDDELRIALEAQEASRGTPQEPLYTEVVEDILADRDAAKALYMPTRRDYMLKN